MPVVIRAPSVINFDVCFPYSSRKPARGYIAQVHHYLSLDAINPQNLPRRAKILPAPFSEFTKRLLGTPFTGPLVPVNVLEFGGGGRMLVEWRGSGIKQTIPPEVKGGEPCLHFGSTRHVREG